MKNFTLLICFVITLGSCEKSDSENSDIAETGVVVELGAFSAKIQGVCRQKPEKALSVIYGIEYSENDLNTNATDVEATQISSDGKFDVCIDELTANTSYYYRAYVLFNKVYYFGDIKTFTTSSHPQPEKVDLGVGVKWASFNISASSPEKYGKYYAWGETKPKSFYSWGTYAWCKDGQELKLTKYVPDDFPEFWFGDGPVDNKKVLDLEDDVARKELGKPWRMPTIGDFSDLVSGCFWQWCTDYKGSGIRGYIVFKAKNPKDRGKIKSPERSDIAIGDYSIDNDVHIFLPAAGFRWDDVTMGDKGDVALGYYRSSSLQADDAPPYGGGTPNYAVDMCFSVFYTDTCDYYERCFAMPIRAVADD
ncbi:MAG: hypothetical protein Q3994_01015 [Prevotella sp.]|nr:hypothetical protein [Prevotella sp.]